MRKVILSLVCIILMGTAKSAFAGDLQWIIDTTKKIKNIPNKDKEYLKQVEIDLLKANKGDPEAQYKTAET